MRSEFQFDAVKTSVLLSVLVTSVPLISMTLPSLSSDDFSVIVTLSVVVEESPSSGADDRRIVNVVETPFSSVSPEAAEM